MLFTISFFTLGSFEVHAQPKEYPVLSEQVDSPELRIQDMLMNSLCHLPCCTRPLCNITCHNSFIFCVVSWKEYIKKNINQEAEKHFIIVVAFTGL